MGRFLKRHEGRIKGIIAGFDRILFKGSLRSISSTRTMTAWLNSRGILLKDFGAKAMELSATIKQHAQAYAKGQNRPYIYLTSPNVSKEEEAMKMAEKDQIKVGLICVFGCVEPSRTFKVGPNKDQKRLELRSVDRPCMHVYFYYMDREFGLMHVRLQTWLPFTIQVCCNGWEYLSRRLDAAGIAYEKRDNCFAHIEKMNRAQKIMDNLTVRKWAPWLKDLAKTVNPWINPKYGLSLRSYYWSMRESEYATDVIFRDSSQLQAIYPHLVQHAIQNFSSQDVLRFLQRRTNSRFNGEIRTDLKHRIEGVRIKHWVEENSIKMYDKQGCVLRIETTINNPRRWKVWRRATRKGKRCKAWIPMRRGIIDVRRRAEICRASNERYLDALSVVGETLPSHKILDPISKTVHRNGRSFRPLRPISPEDSKLFAVISNGNFLLHDFRNKDLRKQLFPLSDKNRVLRRQASSKVSRLIRLFREHGLVAKVPKNHSYRLTEKGYTTISVSLNLRRVNALSLAA